MKLVYIATAVNDETGDTIQENAYTTAERALEQAKLMCKDLRENAGYDVHAEVIPMDLYEGNEPVVTYVADINSINSITG